MKKAVKEIMQKAIEAETEDEYNVVCGMINKAFENEKITWAEHELLYELICKMF